MPSSRASTTASTPLHPPAAGAPRAVDGADRSPRVTWWRAEGEGLIELRVSDHGEVQRAWLAHRGRAGGDWTAPREVLSPREIPREAWGVARDALLASTGPTRPLPDDAAPEVLSGGATTMGVMVDDGERRWSHVWAWESDAGLAVPLGELALDRALLAWALALPGSELFAPDLPPPPTAVEVAAELIEGLGAAIVGQVGPALWVSVEGDSDTLWISAGLSDPVGHELSFATRPDVAPARALRWAGELVDLALGAGGWAPGDLVSHPTAGAGRLAVVRDPLGDEVGIEVRRLWPWSPADLDRAEREGFVAALLAMRGRPHTLPVD